jgi:hypothetical protein
MSDANSTADSPSGYDRQLQKQVQKAVMALLADPQVRAVMQKALQSSGGHAPAPGAPSSPSSPSEQDVLMGQFDRANKDRPADVAEERRQYALGIGQAPPRAGAPLMQQFFRDNKDWLPTDEGEVSRMYLEYAAAYQAEQYAANPNNAGVGDDIRTGRPGHVSRTVPVQVKDAEWEKVKFLGQAGDHGATSLSDDDLRRLLDFAHADGKAPWVMALRDLLNTAMRQDGGAAKQLICEALRRC